MSVPDLPSWVPDWHCGDEFEPIALGTGYRAEPSAFLISEALSGITINAQIVDTVDYISPALQSRSHLTNIITPDFMSVAVLKHRTINLQPSGELVKLHALLRS